MLVQHISPVAGDEFAPIFVALELSRSKWLVGVGTPRKWAVRRHEVDGGDLDGLLALLRRVAAGEEQRGGVPVRVHICFEAGRDGHWLYRALKVAGYGNPPRLIRRGVGQYIGLAPSPFQSGDMARDQGIAKAGNSRARKAMIELAWLWRRHQPDSALSTWFRERVGDRKGRVRRIAIVAMARKLAVALWRYLETGLVPEGAVLKRA